MAAYEQIDDPDPVLFQGKDDQIPCRGVGRASRIAASKIPGMVCCRRLGDE